MPYVTSQDMLISAQAASCAVGAFNIENLEMIQAVIWAAEETKRPVILQTTPPTAKYTGLESIAAAVRAIAEKSSAYVALHLDHGTDFELCIRALHAGYSSVMIDGSRLSLADNIALTTKVVEACAPCGIPVEGELGAVGGKEDGLESGVKAGDDGYTIPTDAREFVARTGVSALAVGIGTAHGVYATAPVLDTNRLSEIRAAVDVPLVLHGASGLHDEEVRDCIRRGIAEVNYATELRIAFSDGVKEFLKENPTAYDPKQYLARGREAVLGLAKEKLMMLQ